MNEVIKYELRCRIPNPASTDGICNALICKAPPFVVPEPGALAGKNDHAVVNAIGDHLLKAHKVVIGGDWQQFLGYLSLGFVQSQDPGHSLFLARYAKHLCDISCVPVQDADIVTVVASLGFEQSDERYQKIIDAMKRVRDVTSRRIPLAEQAGLG